MWTQLAGKSGVLGLFGENGEVSIFTKRAQALFWFCQIGSHLNIRSVFTVT